MNRHNCQNRTGEAADEAAEEPDLDAQRQAIEWRRHQEEAALVGGVAGGAVGLLQEVQDLRIEDEGHDPKQRDGDRRDEETVAHLGEVFGQRHAGLGFTESRHFDLVQ